MDKHSENHQVIVRKAAQEAVSALSLRDDDALREIFRRSRVERDDAYRVMDEYGVDFGVPPSSAYEGIEISGTAGSGSYYKLEVYLWDSHGNPTDLSAILTVTLKHGVAQVELDDLRVM